MMLLTIVDMAFGVFKETNKLSKKQRLDKVLSHMGLGTRKEIRTLVRQKSVTVNGAVISDSGYKVLPEQDDIQVLGERIVFREFIYVMMNKPQGVISATEDAVERTVLDLLDDSLTHFKPFPAGRLDKDTEGLLLLTNDGQLAHSLLSPRRKIAKTYYVEVDGVLGEQDITDFERGVTLDDGYMTLPAKLDIITSGQQSQCHLTIVEGKFHQVKRMFKQVGKQVTYLQRVQMGSLVLDPELRLGQYRELTTEEIHQLKALLSPSFHVER